MREVVLDTETTGFDPSNGDRIVSIGLVEIVNKVMTGRNVEWFLNPEGKEVGGSEKIHGLTDNFLSDKPRFIEVKKDFIDFIQNDPLVIHNAKFDIGFLNAEMKRHGLSELNNPIIDTLKIARKMPKPKKNSLDALCIFYKIDISDRKQHGALKDAILLGQVYKEMSKGEQSNLSFKSISTNSSIQDENKINSKSMSSLEISLTQNEVQDHEEFVNDALGSDAIWKYYN